MNDTVKVEFNEIDTSIKKIEGLLESLATEIDSAVKNVTGDTNAWDTKYQKVFDKHLNSETAVFIKKVINNCGKYNSYLKKTMQGYRKIDVYR